MKSAMDFQIERIFKGPGFAETLYLGFKNGMRVIRKASNPDAYSFSKTALIREIRLIKSLPDELKQFFPTLLDTNLGDEPENSSGIPDVIYYDMPYYSPEEGWVTLSQSLLDGRIVKKDARKVLGEVMEVAFRYFQIDERIPSPDYPEKTMFTAIRESIKWAGSDEDFTSLFTVKKWLINGKEICNVPSLNKYFQEASPLIDILTPYRDRFLHGDFFPENIMFNKKPDILLTKMLDKAALHQRVIASNVANIGTPGYERLGVSFEEKLAKAVRQGKKMRTSHPRHMPSSSWLRKLKPEVVKIENDYSNGINNDKVYEKCHGFSN